MAAILAFIKKHPVPTYFGLTFLISWAGVLIVVGPGGIPSSGEQFEILFPFVFLAMLAGPSIAGILLTGLVYRRTGLREVLSGLLRWRVGARWYGVALLAAPLLITATLGALSLISPMFRPELFISDQKASLLLFGIAVALGAGFFEELGWTALAVCRLRPRHDVLPTGLIVGVLWGAWHFLVNVWGGRSASGALSSALVLPMVLLSLLVGALPAYRVLMVWVYDRTGSLLVAMLMHASLTASTLILRPAATGVPLVIYDFVLAGVLWAVVAAVVVATSRQRSRKPIQRAQAPHAAHL
jgi:uncharacterized protein